MADLAELGIKVTSDDINKAIKRLDKLEDAGNRAEKSSGRLKGSFSALGAAATALAPSMLVSKFIDTAGAFESMSKSLETVTGSAERAAMAMAGITEFAQNTPFSVRELTDSFIKLKALGIKPTEENLISFGNTASAMGKSLNQMIEAVADASTGEFERLKEFGIKASTEGENVSFTFQGITTTVRKSSKEITEYLEGIGETNFSGAMAMQMDTINGKISNLGDSVDLLFLKFSESGGGATAKMVLDGMIDAVNWLAVGVGKLPGLIVSLIAEFDKMVTHIIYGARSAYEYVTGILDSDEERLAKQKALNAEKEREIENIERAAQMFIESEMAKADAQRVNAASGISGATGDMVEAPEEKTAKELEAERKKREELLKIENDYYERLYNLQSGFYEASTKFAENAKKGEYKNALKYGSLMLSTAAETNKTLFEVQKAASLANAAVTLPSAVLKSFENGGGYPWGLIPAGLMLYQGIKQIQAIKNTSFGGGGSVPSVGGGGGSTSPAAPVASGLPPGATATPGAEEQQTRRIELNFIGDDDGMVSTAWIRDKMLPSLKEAIDDGYTL